MSALRTGGGLALGALALALAWALGAPAPGGSRAGAEPHGPSGAADAVLGVSITVSDLERAVGFYTGALGFEEVSRWEGSSEEQSRLLGVFGARTRTARLRLGAEFVELTDFLAPEGLPAPGDSRSTDEWFQHIAIVVSDMDRAYAHLREHDVGHASPGPQRLPDWNPNAGGIEAFYFRDPDGHTLEIIAFPEGKGDPRWREAGGRLFLGIDHTAIVVDDTERALGFYRGGLGMRVAGESENYGAEQERLNGVFGARLRITALRAAAGPGVELLEYLSPGGGRDYPRDARACDVLHWHTIVGAADAGAALSSVGRAASTWVSPGVVEAPWEGGPARRAALVRDPDGHAVMLVEQEATRP